VHQFLLAYESRDVERLIALFAPDAVADAREGREAIRADFERAFAGVTDVVVSVPRIDVAERGDRLDVTGPLVVSYRERDGALGRLRGTGRWEITVRDGEPRIVRLSRDLAPDPS
jgi:ketosteroid isomerase-like protein